MMTWIEEKHGKELREEQSEFSDDTNQETGAISHHQALGADGQPARCAAAPRKLRCFHDLSAPSRCIRGFAWEEKDDRLQRAEPEAWQKDVKRKRWGGRRRGALDGIPTDEGWASSTTMPYESSIQFGPEMRPDLCFEKERTYVSGAAARLVVSFYFSSPVLIVLALSREWMETKVLRFSLVNESMALFQAIFLLL